MAAQIGRELFKAVASMEHRTFELQKFMRVEREGLKFVVRKDHPRQRVAGVGDLGNRKDRKHSNEPSRPTDPQSGGRIRQHGSGAAH